MNYIEEAKINEKIFETSLFEHIVCKECGAILNKKYIKITAISETATVIYNRAGINIRFGYCNSCDDLLCWAI